MEEGAYRSVGTSWGGRLWERGRLFEEIWYLVSFINDIATSIEQLGNNYINSH